jgi:cathepsin L
MLLIVFASAVRGDERKFLAWMRHHQLTFTGTEYHRRYQIWLSNLRLVESHNRNPGGPVLQMNRFAASTATEYHSLLLPGLVDGAQFSPLASNDSAGDVNWTRVFLAHNINFPVRDQNRDFCASDWAFAAIDAIQSSWAADYLLNPRYVCNLSVAFVLHCAPRCFGCDGGNVARTYRWLIDTHKGCILSDDSWPYNETSPSETGGRQCPTALVPGGAGVAGVRLSDFWKARSEDDLASLCERFGPVAAAIDASRPSFALYASGIYEDTECSAYNLNLAVLVVGFGTDAGRKYWIVKNSWGTDWGEWGYMRLLRQDNHCGIASMAYLPVI